MRDETHPPSLTQQQDGEFVEEKGPTAAPHPFTPAPTTVTACCSTVEVKTCKKERKKYYEGAIPAPLVALGSGPRCTTLHRRHRRPHRPRRKDGRENRGRRREPPAEAQDQPIRTVGIGKSEPDARGQGVVEGGGGHPDAPHSQPTSYRRSLAAGTGRPPRHRYHVLRCCCRHGRCRCRSRSQPSRLAQPMKQASAAAWPPSPPPPLLPAAPPPPRPFPWPPRSRRARSTHPPGEPGPAPRRSLSRSWAQRSPHLPLTLRPVAGRGCPPPPHLHFPGLPLAVWRSRPHPRLHRRLRCCHPHPRPRRLLQTGRGGACACAPRARARSAAARWRRYPPPQRPPPPPLPPTPPPPPPSRPRWRRTSHQPGARPSPPRGGAFGGSGGVPRPASPVRRRR